MWHLRKRAFNHRCYKNPDRKQAYSAEVASGSSGSKGSNSDYGGENEQGTQIKSEANPVEVVVIHVVAVEFFSWSWKDRRCTTWWRTLNEFL